MSKKLTNILSSLLLIGIGMLLESDAFSQQQRSTLPTNKVSAEVKRKLLRQYIEITSDTSTSKRQKARKIFVGLPKEEKAYLFKFHLAMQHIARPDLNPEQREVIYFGISELSADAYGPPDSPESIKAKERLKPFEQRTREVFSEPVSREIVASIGLDSRFADLMKSYESITSVYSENDRRKLFQSSSAKQRSGAFQTHLAAEMASRQLNMEQYNLISEAISIASESNYGFEEGSAERKTLLERLKAFGTKVDKNFLHDEITVIFGTLGGKKAMPLSKAHSLILSKFSFLNIRFIKIENERQGCNANFLGCSCSVNSDFCGSKSHCEFGNGGGGCDSSNGGCGWFWLYNCTGVCWMGNEFSPLGGIVT